MASSFLKKKAKEQAEKLEKQYGSSAYGGVTWLEKQLDEELAPVKHPTKDAAPVRGNTTGFASDEYVSKTILGTTEEAYSFLDKLNQAKEVGDSTSEAKYQYLYDQSLKKKKSNEYKTKLSKITMDGSNRSVYAEAQLVAAMDDGDEKEERKKALLKKIKSVLESGSKWDGWLDPFDDGVSAVEIIPFLADTLNKVTTIGNPSKDGYDENEVYALLTGEARDASVADVTWKSLKRGYVNSRYGEESFNAMNGVANEKEKYEYILAGDEYNFETDNWFGNAISGGAELLGQQVRQWTNPRTLALAGGSAAMAAIAGQAGPQVALPEEVVTVPTAALAGFAAGSSASSLEIEAGFAYNEMIEAGITEETARKIALGVGTVNAGLEAFQLDELLDAYKITNATGATKSFTKRILDELLKRGVNVAKETAQEVAQESVTMGGVQLGSQIDKGEDAYTWGEVGERLKDTAVSSALSFGVMNAPATVRNTVSIGAEHRAANTLTDNEQKVVDKVVADEVAKREEAGEKITSKLKSDIRKETIERMEKGDISTDTIEEVLGGDNFKAYKDILDSENALKDEQKALQEEQKALEEELKPLSKKVWHDMTGEEHDRREEIKARLPEIQNELNEIGLKLGDTNTIAQRNVLKAQLDKDTFELAKKDRLRESYFEAVRSKQKYEADVNQYTGRAKKVIQQVMDSGLADNTNKSHEFWDWAANMANSMDKDVTLANNEQILEMVKAEYEAEGLEFDASKFEGQIIDGYVSKNGIVLNAESKRALNFVVGHEITHTLERTGHYAKLQKLLFEYAKGEYETRFNERSGQYANKFKADEKYKSKVDKEVTGDLVGDYIFNDKGFIDHLAKDRNTFQRVWDEIKHMAKIATAGSEQARQLAKVKREFERAWREANKAQKNTADGGVQFSLDRTQNMSWSDQINGALYDGKNIRRNDTLVVGQPTDTAVANDIDNKPLAIPQSVLTKASSGKDISHSIKRGKLAKLDEGIKNAPITIFNPDRNAVVYVTNIKQGGLPIVAAFDLNAEFDGDSVHKATSIHLQVDTMSMLKNLPESATVYIRKNELDPVGVTNNLRSLAAKIEFIDGTVSQKGSNVKGQFSLSDSDGRQLSEGQIDYFQDSKIRDADGNLKVMYHGSPETFTVFDRKKAKTSGYYGKGFYFTDSDSHAGQYGSKYEVYLNITNPLQDGTNDITKEQLRKFVEAIADNEDYGIDNYGYGATVDSVADSVYGKSDFAMLMDINASCVGNMVEAIELFNEVNGTDYNGIIAPTETVAFYPNQIKQVGNKAPTSDPDIRFSVSSKADKDYLDAVNRGDTETAQKMVDEAAKAAGYVERVFHGTKKFGFTQFDTSFSDDKISFFATSSDETVKTYSGIGGKRGISDSFDTVKISPEVAEEINSMHEKLRGKIDDFASEVDRLFGNEGTVKTDEMYDVMNQYAESVVQGKMSKDRAEAKVTKYIQKMLQKGYNASLRGGESFRKWEKTNEYYRLTRMAINAYSTARWIAKTIGGSLKDSGNYDLYANTEGLLVIEGNDANWNDLQSDILPSATSEAYKKYNRITDGTWTTRSIAKYAFDNGYTGVLFKNIYDHGGKVFSELSKSADVYAFFHPESQLKSADPVTYDNKGNVIQLSQRFNTENDDIRYSVSAKTDSDGNQLSVSDASYMDAVNRGDTETAQKMVYDAAKNAGYEHQMFHETDAENIHVFDITRGDHGKTDYETPYGIFTKTSAKNIGLGSRQMSLLVKAQNTLYVENREDVRNKIPGFEQYYNQIQEIDSKYDALAEQLEDEEFDALQEWMEENPDADMDVVYPTSYIIEGKPADIDSERYQEAHRKYQENQAEWSEAYDAVAVKAKGFITEYLRNNGYDSMYFKVDGGSFGRQTDSLIVLDPNQVKSAEAVTKDDSGNVIPLSERFNADSDDTRYSISDIGQQHRDTGGYQYYSHIPGDDIAPVADIVAPTDAERLGSLTDADAPMDDIAPVKPVKETYEAIRPKPSNEPRMVRADSKGKQRKWVGTSTESDAVDGKVLPEDLDQDLIHYQPISNKKTLGNANNKLNSMGYEDSVAYMNSQFANNKVTLDDIALGERLIQEAVKRGDTKTASDLIMDISILGTELGQKVQALSIIKRLTPEGQLRMLQRTVERGKTKGDKAFEGVEITQDMIDYILKTYGKDGTYDQAELNKRVEDVKQQLADQMNNTAMDYINEWRYLSMLGNPKTHIRNIVSNVAMWGTRQVKNAVARTIEDIAPVKNRTKTWKFASKDVKEFAKQAAIEEYKDNTDNKYSEGGSIKAKRQILPGVLGKASNVNSKALSGEDTFFSKPAFRTALSEYLTANGITTKADIEKNGKLVAEAKAYAMKQAKEATFQQDSYIASKISEIERKNPLYNVAIGSVLPFKKTPINIAKTAAAYSPLGLARNIYDAVQVGKGNMDASEAIDHFAQTLTGTSLAVLGYMWASAGILNGAGEDDKEGEYDYQLGEQSYSFNFNGDTFSLSWLSPVAMPLFVGANAYEQLVEGKDWNADMVFESLAQTLDPLSEMSFLSSLDSVLSSYDSGVEKFMGIFESAGQSYISQFAPTLMSQVAQATDDTKRSTKASADSGFKFGEETMNKLIYKIPGLRQTLEPTTDIWGNEVKQTEDGLTRAFESFIAPYARREDIATEIDEEIKDLYRQTGDTGLIPSIPNNYVSYDGVKYEMSAKEFTDFKKDYGQTAYSLMEQLFGTETYQNADSETRAEMVNRVYDYARDEARKGYFAKHGVNFTNATEDGKEVYKENAIKGAIEADLPVDEYKFSEEYPEKYSFFKENGITYDDYASADEDGKRAYTWAYENPSKYTMSKAISDDLVTYRKYTGDLYDIKADKDSNGESISGSAKEKKIDYINRLDLDYGQKIILYRSLFSSKEDRATYNADILEYLNSRNDISYEDKVTILKELDYTVDSKGNVTWD